MKECFLTTLSKLESSGGSQETAGTGCSHVVILNNTGKRGEKIYTDGSSDGGNIIIFVLFSKLSLTFQYCLCNNDNF